MSKQQSELNKVLSILIGSLNPEVEKDFLNYIETKSIVDKTMQIYDDSVEFIDTFTQTILVDEVSSEEDKNRIIMSSVINRLLHDLALLYDVTRCDEM